MARYLSHHLITKVMRELKLRQVKTGVGDDDMLVGRFPPFITVSREPGSGGHPIAEMVAKKLGYSFYDSAIIEDIAKSAKLRKSVLEEVDEKGRSLVTDFIHGLFNPEYVSDATYMRHLCKVILSVAYKGKVVILGRGSNFITPFAAGLHVRVTAPYRVRLQRAIDFEGHSPAKARKVIKGHEKDRKEFVKQYFGKSIVNPKHYDMVINTSFLSMEDAADLIVNAYKKKFSL